MNSHIDKIVCPIDFSELSELALAQAVDIATQNGAELLLINVIQPVASAQIGDGAFLTELQPLTTVPPEVAQERLAQLRETTCATVRERTSLHVATGVPFVEIVRYAREVEADLIVMGSHGRTGIEHLLIGSVAERVVRKAPCSVLVVRNVKQRFVMP
jgi:nucleotide-binding universal stress UspA family protein